MYGGQEIIYTNLFRSVDDSSVVTELQRADDGGAQREQEITSNLLLLKGQSHGKENN